MGGVFRYRQRWVVGSLRRFDLDSGGGFLWQGWCRLRRLAAVAKVNHSLRFDGLFRVALLLGSRSLLHSLVILSSAESSSEVNDLSEASKSIATLQALLDRDMASNCVRNAGSHSRNLLRVKRGLDMVWVLFEQILIADWFLVDSYEQRELIAFFHKLFAEGIGFEYICLSGLFAELAMRFQFKLQSRCLYIVLKVHA
ncbi:hypothetical protein L484_025259 [Morus notabilis]|uniref:Glycolipid transfer protein domain-containing protein n=1 Tax=Morus notabilis TaxID=981085 RepID=W9S2B2_9ROSA|nr:hypothetical protein L484_025259 [Morus notabilis]